MRRKTLAQLEAECMVWNFKYPIGTEVQYRPVLGDPYYRVRATRAPAYVLSGHTAVVFLEGESGCIALDNCTPIEVGIPKTGPGPDAAA